MDIPFSQRLSFKQAGLAVLVAVVLGALFSLLQVSLDYASEDATLNRDARAILAIGHEPASRALAERDGALARELLLSLAQAPAVLHVELVDGAGRLLGSTERAARDDGWRRHLSSRLFGERRSFVSALPSTAAASGQLRLEIDTFIYGQRFLRRAGVTLANGFVCSLLLSLILLGLFYLLLTRPLTSLIDAIGRRDPQATDQPPLPCPRGHQRDEIGVLVKVCNRQLSLLGEEIAQRRAAEEHLTYSLGELEQRVRERTGELENANRELREANHELQQAQRATLAMAQSRAQFLASMSHEIRTPLNGLLGMLALALENPLPTQLRQQLGIAHDSGRVLVELLNGVLDLSKFEAGRLELEQTPFDLASLVEETATLLSQNAAPGVELSCLIAPDLPGEVIGDPLRVRQIVGNLLSNALKFTRHGRVDVRLSTNRDGLLLEVCDTGIGIAREALARIFQPFTQAEAGTSRQFGGTGLGLTLTRRLCEAMHASLEVESEQGSGSRFSVRLPLPAHAGATALPPLRGKVVALCSAHSGLSELLQTWLPTWGVEFLRLDSDAGLADIEVDLLIADGPECLLGRRPQVAAPILLVSAYGSFLSDEDAERLQPLEQLARPLPRVALYQALQRSLGRLAPASAAPPPATRQPRILLVEDNSVNQLVVTGLLGHLGLTAEIARQGEEALKILQQQDFDLVLMDCNMPLMDGYEATRQIRRDDRLARLPVIALTANVLPEERERCRQAGMNDYLSKPLRREELQAVLERWLPGALTRGA